MTLGPGGKEQYLFVKAERIRKVVSESRIKEILLCKKEWNLAICNGGDGTREYYAKQNNSVRERQIPCDLMHMQNLRNKTNEHRQKETNQKTDS